MKKIVHYIGLDVHKETIAVAIAPEQSAEIRKYGIIGGTLDAMDKLIKKVQQENIELRFAYEAGRFPCARRASWLPRPSHASSLASSGPLPAR